MKKVLTIHLIDGTKHEVDLQPLATKLPLGAPANHNDYKVLCQQFGMGGYYRLENTKTVDYVPPSMITNITVKFD